MSTLYQKRGNALVELETDVPKIAARLSELAETLAAHAAAVADAQNASHVRPDGETSAVGADGALKVINSPLWAGRAIFTSTGAPNAAQGKVGDLWVQVAG